MKEEELNDLKYRELQKLAKDNGVKANLPKSALIEALLEVFEANKDSTELAEPKDQSDVPSQEDISNIPAEADENFDPLDKDQKVAEKMDDTSSIKVTNIEKEIIKEADSEIPDPNEEEEMIKLQLIDEKDIDDTKTTFNEEDEDVKDIDDTKTTFNEEDEDVKVESEKKIEANESDETDEKNESDSEEELEMNKKSVEKTDEKSENKDNDMFIISTQPSQEPEKINESSDDEEITNDESDSDEDQRGNKKLEEKEADEKSESENEDNNTFFISTQPSKEPEKIKEDSASDKDNTDTDDDDENEPNENQENLPKKEAKKRKKKQSSDKAGRKYPKYNEESEQSLEKFLFGKVSGVGTKIFSSSESEAEEEEESSNQKPQWTSTVQASKSSDSEDSDTEKDKKNKDHKKTVKTKEKKPAWHDEDDDDVKVKEVTATYTKAIGKHGKKETSTENYAQSLRKQFSNLMDRPKWAKLEVSKDSEDSDDEFFRETTDTLATGKSLLLKKGFIESRKLKDINYTTHNEGSVIRCAEFHPTNAIGLVAGINGTASLFEIDGKMNRKLKSIHLENFPIKTAHFTSNGKQFIAGSQQYGHFFAYDLTKDKVIRIPWKEDREQHSMQKFEVSPTDDLMAFHGRYGNIHLLSSKSRSKIFSLKMNDGVEAVSFSPDGEYLYSHGVGGEVYIWDLKAQQCVHKFVDDGCNKGTALAVSRNNRYLACGSTSGVVNIYKRTDFWNQTNPTPEKIVLNLTTSVSSIKFNPTSEILAMASEVKENAVKLLHLPSMTVFSNFPSYNYNFKRPNCIDFSLNGGFFSVGNNRGAANLFRFKHYGSY